MIWKEETAMKKFEMPEIQVEKFSIEDVITTSTVQGGDDQLPLV